MFKMDDIRQAGRAYLGRRTVYTLKGELQTAFHVHTPAWLVVNRLGDRK